jgi:hypothetical protein
MQRHSVRSLEVLFITRMRFGEIRPGLLSLITCQVARSCIAVYVVLPGLGAPCKRHVPVCSSPQLFSVGKTTLLRLL